MKRDIKTVTEMAVGGPLSEGQLRWLLFNSKTNGLRDANAVVKIGRRVFIDQDAFDKWIDKQNTHARLVDRKQAEILPMETIRKIIEQCCSKCEYEECDGTLFNHCNDCLRKIVRELWVLSHQ